MLSCNAGSCKSSRAFCSLGGCHHSVRRSFCHLDDAASGAAVAQGFAAARSSEPPGGSIPVGKVDQCGSVSDKHSGQRLRQVSMTPACARRGE